MRGSPQVMNQSVIVIHYNFIVIKQMDCGTGMGTDMGMGMGKMKKRKKMGSE